MADTKIEWTHGPYGKGVVWNFLRGCSPESPGCTNCWAKRQAIRLAGPGQRYEGLVENCGNGPQWTGKLRLAEDKLSEILHWTRTPRMAFVNSTSDLFHPAVTDEQLDLAFAYMLAAQYFINIPRHRLLLLTKRAQRMREYLSAPPAELLQRWSKAGDYRIHLNDGDVFFSEAIEGTCSCLWGPDRVAISEHRPWGYPENLFPLRDLWLGVTAEDQRRADERLIHLRETPAAVRWVSYEPAIGSWEPRCTYACNMNICALDWLDWVVVGGESGPKARPCSVDWLRIVVEQCRDTDTACFVKQLGSRPERDVGTGHGTIETRPLHLRNRKGADMSEWPEELRVRQWPEVRA